MTVDEFIDAQPQRELLVALRALVRRVAPEAREEMKWHVPFYSHHGMLCCFEMSGRDAVVMCFCWGADLEDPDGILRGEWRRTRTVTVRTLRDVRRRALADMLRRALARNEARRPPRSSRRR
jgi:hypothetical protein